MYKEAPGFRLGPRPISSFLLSSIAFYDVASMIWQAPRGGLVVRREYCVLAARRYGPGLALRRAAPRPAGRLRRRRRRAPLRRVRVLPTGRAVQDDSFKTRVESTPWFQRLKLEYHTMLSTFALYFNLGCYTLVDLSPELGFTQFWAGSHKVGWCRLIVSKPVLKAPMLSALETRTS